jgi:hypothetical protein
LMPLLLYRSAFMYTEGKEGARGGGCTYEERAHVCVGGGGASCMLVGEQLGHHLVCCCTVPRYKCNVLGRGGPRCV